MANFVSLFFNRNYINRAVAAILLLALIFIHGVKLLHNHSFNLFSTTETALKTEVVTTDHASSFYFSGDCDICNYHLTKDADSFVSKTGCCYAKFFIDHHSQLISFQKLFPFSSFENRGPPINI